MTDSTEPREDEPLVAQIERVFPELVTRDEDGEIAVFVGGVLMALVRAMGELEDRLVVVEKRQVGGEPAGRRTVEMDESSVGKLRQLRGVTWEWRDDVPEGVADAPGLGVIAQDVQRVFPELVERDDADGYLAVHYYGLIGPLIEAVKELDDRLRAVESGGSPGTAGSQGN